MLESTQFIMGKTSFPRLSLRSRSIAITIAAGLALAAFCLPLTAEDSLPDAPVPQQDGATPNHGSSSSQAAPPETTAAQKSRHDTAAEQLCAQEKQRVLGILPNFNTTYVGDAVSLSPGRKIHMAFRTAIDPFTFATASVVGGLNELDDDPSFGWGPEGYFKRAGASYLTAIILKTAVTRPAGHRLREVSGVGGG